MDKMNREENQLMKTMLIEELSISDEVLTATKEIALQIFEQFKSYQWYEDYDGFRKKHYMFIPNLSNGNKVGVRYVVVNIIDFKTRKNYDQYYGDLKENAHFNPTTRSIEIYVPYFGKKIAMKEIYAILSHEIEHSFQSTFHNLSSYKNILGKLNLIMNRFPENTDEYNMAYCLYYFSKPEIDAHTNEFYYELYKNKIKSIKEINYCHAIRLKNALKKIYNEIKNKNSAEEVFSFIGLSRTEVYKYLDRQIHYSERKFNHVVQRYFNEISNPPKKTYMHEDFYPKIK